MVGIGTLAGYAGGPVLTVAAAVVVAVLFHPVRQRASLLANRFVYGRRASPYQVLADFAQDMAGQLDADAALDRMAAVLGGATGAERVEVWVLVGAALSPAVGLAGRRAGSRARDGDPRRGPGRARAGRPGDRRVPPGRAARRHHAGEGQERTGARRRRTSCSPTLPHKPGSCCATSG